MLSRKLLLVTLSILFVLVVTADSFAQLGTSAINGKVVDTSGAVIGGAVVMVQNSATGQTRETITTEDGSYVIQNLSPAVYRMKIMAPGFAEVNLKEISLRVGETVTVVGKLVPETTSEVIEVQADIGVDTTTSQVTSFISDLLVANLPLNGRNFLDLAFLLPGNRPAPNFDTVQKNTIQITTSGQSSRGNNLTIDGGDNNNDFFGGNLQNLPQDAVREFQIITDRSNAEVGRTLASAINVITQSGTNKFHGSAGIFFRNDDLSALPATLDPNVVATQGSPSFDREQYTASLGGPIKINRAWFFGAVEYRHQDAVALAGQRDVNRQQILTTYTETPLRNTLFTLRADWQITMADRMTFRYNFDNDRLIDLGFGFDDRPSISASHRIRSRNRFQSFVYNLAHTFSPKLINDFTFQISRFRNHVPVFTNGPELLFPSVSDGSSPFVPNIRNQDRYQFRDNVSLLAGNHSVKFGAEIQHIKALSNVSIASRGTIFFDEDFAPFDRNGDGVVNDFDLAFSLVFTNEGMPPIASVKNNYIGLYVQDDWKITPNFTLNLGLRYELDTDVKNISGFNLISQQIGSLAAGNRERDKNNLGPRIGFNWDPFKDGRTSIHGGYGIYYGRVPLALKDLERNQLNFAGRLGTIFDDNGNFLPFSPTLAAPFSGPILFGAGIVIIDNKLETPTVQQFNFGIRREVIPGLNVSVDGVHIFGTHFITQQIIGQIFDPRVNAPGQIRQAQSPGKNWYDGLLINVERRATKYLSFITSYTLSKSLGTTDDGLVTLLIPNTDIKLEKGPVDTDERHRFTFAGVIDLPYGLRISPIYTLASDVPVDILLFGPNRLPFAQRNAGGRQFRTGAELNQFINQINAGGGVAGFGPVPLVNPNLKFGDSFNSLDLRVSKTFKVTEAVSINAIVEMFNVFNIANIRGALAGSFSGFRNVLVRDSFDPNSSGFLTSSSFGQKLETAGGVFGSGGPRAVQFAFRLSF
ncbi:MAG: TonB-dependent receptor [Acidobacteriota bacterium]